MRKAVRALYRVRGILYYITAVAFVFASFVAFSGLGGVPESVQRWLAFLIAASVLVCVLLIFFGRGSLPERDAVLVASPVRGRWVGLNSPATKTPSHGIYLYGQSHAIDLAAEPKRGARPVFGVGPWMREPKDYPAFGMPVHAMIDGVVVHARDRKRDHRARSGWVSLAYLMIEGMVREIGGPGCIVGNHITIRGEDGTFALVAHIRQGSALVRPGDVVTAGQMIGACGNSGNSSEPHVHAQLMDRASLWTAQGIPMEFAQVDLVPVPKPGKEDEVEAEERDTVNGLPKNGQHMIVG